MDRFSFGSPSPSPDPESRLSVVASQIIGSYEVECQEDLLMQVLREYERLAIDAQQGVRGRATWSILGKFVSAALEQNVLPLLENLKTAGVAPEVIRVLTKDYMQRMWNKIERALHGAEQKMLRNDASSTSASQAVQTKIDALVRQHRSYVQPHITARLLSAWQEAMKAVTTEKGKTKAMKMIRKQLESELDKDARDLIGFLQQNDISLELAQQATTQNYWRMSSELQYILRTYEGHENDVGAELSEEDLIARLVRKHEKRAKKAVRASMDNYLEAFVEPVGNNVLKKEAMAKSTKEYALVKAMEEDVKVLMRTLFDAGIPTDLAQATTKAYARRMWKVFEAKIEEENQAYDHVLVTPTKTPKSRSGTPSSTTKKKKKKTTKGVSSRLYSAPSMQLSQPKVTDMTDLYEATASKKKPKAPPREEEGGAVPSHLYLSHDQSNTLHDSREHTMAATREITASPPMGDMNGSSDPPTIAKMNEDAIISWLAMIGLENLSDIFRANNVDGKVLAGITSRKLRDGLSVSSRQERQKLLTAVETLKTNLEDGTWPLSRFMSSKKIRTPVTLTVDEICKWLDDLGLEMHSPRFRQQAVNGSTLLDLTSDRLRSEFGVKSLGHREIILEGIEQLRNLQDAGESVPDVMIIPVAEDITADEEDHTEVNEEVNLGIQFGEGANTHLDIGNPPHLNFAGEVTIEFWMLLMGVENVNVVSKTPRNPSSSADHDEVFVRVKNGNLEAGEAHFLSKLGITVPKKQLSYALTDEDVGRWVHWGVTFTSSSLMWKMYRNGVHVGEVKGSEGVTMDADSSWRIGSRLFPGTVAKLCIWSKSCSEKEVAKCMYKRAEARHPNLLGFWWLIRNSNKGSLIFEDSSAHESHGRLIDCEWVDIGNPPFMTNVDSDDSDEEYSLAVGAEDGIQGDDSDDEDDPSVWKEEKVAIWLEEIGCENHVDAFKANNINGRSLLYLTKEKLLKEVGIASMGERKTIFDYIQNLRQRHGLGSLEDDYLHEARLRQFPEDVLTMSEDDVASWLRKNKLEDYVDMFVSNNVNGELLATLDANSLKYEIGVSSMGHRAKIMDALSELMKAEAKVKATAVDHRLAKVYEMDEEDVLDWLAQIGFSRYEEMFIENNINGALMLKISNKILREEFGMESLEHRKLFLKHLADIKRASLQEIEAEANRDGQFDDRVRDMTVPAVGNWLSDIGLGQYAVVFDEANIGGEQLLTMTADILKSDLQVVSLGHRELIMDAIASLRQEDNQYFAKQETEKAAKDLSNVQMSVDEVKAWLDVIDLSEYKTAFEREAINGERLFALDSSMLRTELGVRSLGHRDRLLTEIDKLRLTLSGDGMSTIASTYDPHATPRSMLSEDYATPRTVDANTPRMMPIDETEAVGDYENRVQQYRPSDMSVDDVGDWLEMQDFGEYRPVVEKAGIDGKQLLKITSDKLREIGINPLGDRDAILEKIAQELKKVESAHAPKEDVEDSDDAIPPINPTPNDLRTPEGVQLFLESMGLGQYNAAFRERGLHGAALRGINAEKLKEIGVASLGHRERLMDSLSGLISLEEEDDGGANASASVQSWLIQKDLLHLFTDATMPDTWDDILHADSKTLRDKFGIKSLGMRERLLEELEQVRQ